MTALRSTARLLPRIAPRTPCRFCTQLPSATTTAFQHLHPAPTYNPRRASLAASISTAATARQQHRQSTAVDTSTDIYELFGLNLDDVPQNGWGINEKDIKSTWRKLMGNTHPDRMAGRSEEDQAQAAQQSTIVNRAYETLLNPLLRAQYLLERHGITSSDEAEGLEDADLLLQVMEFRERLEEVSSEEEAAQVREDNREHLEQTISALGSAFGASPPNLEHARKLTIELRYWLNIDKAAREWAPGARIELQH
ncbi:hypothetical protein CF327_g940 [Tilletia walkeri]|uniref:J domain-containing protein n=1 Tax=Tilletia walkeri TaxID=117179 RepID=A0A8X7T2C5_9BASI|nr:hypothetical protein CF327_g940 [Tilletia walkeri]KAE8263601.1 hypothetical protein A4X09_0g7188 [Tilletia walkeri]